MIIDSPIISGSAAASGSLNQVGNVTITGSLTVTGNISGSFTGSATNAVSASYAVTASHALNVPQTASYAISASNAVSSSYSVTASFALNVPQTASYATTAANAQNADLLDNKNSTEFAVTSSNIFTGQQRITETTNPISFTDTASLYTDGGLRVTKDAYISGSTFIAGNLTVFGTSSIQYVTSSVFVGLEYIDLNTDLPALRYAGIRVYDSGSPSESTSSLLWDSQNNKWIYSNPSTVGYSGGMLISGPRNTGSLGEEQGTINNRIVKGQGGDHITSSQIIDDGTTVSIPGNLEVTGSIVGNLTGTATTASYWSGSIENVASASYAETLDGLDSTAFAILANANSFTQYQTIRDYVNVTGPMGGDYKISGQSIFNSTTNKLPKKKTTGGFQDSNITDDGSKITINSNTDITGSLRINSGTIYGDLEGTSSFTTTASFASTASFALNVPLTSSFALTASYWSGSIDTASFALTASYATNAGAGAGFPFSGSAVITGSLLVTELSGSGTAYLVADSTGLIQKQAASAALKTTQAFTSSAGQTTFSVTNGYTTNYVDVFINGIKLSAGEFTDTSGTNIVLTTGSFSGDIVEVVKYLPAEGVSTNVLRQQTTFVANAEQTIFSASYVPGLLDIFYNGSRLSNNEYTANSGTYFTLATASIAGDVLDIFNYSYQVGGFTGIGGSGSSTQVAYFSTGNALTGSPNFTISGSTMTVTGSLLVSGSGTFTNIGPAVFSGSIIALQGISGTASLATTASSADDFLVRNTLTAQTLVVQTITSSVDFVTGSTRFGSILSNTHVFSGSVTMNPNGLFVSSSGFVGIGTIAPTTPFHVNGSSSRVAVITTSGALSSGYYDAFQMLAANQTGGGLSLNIGKAESQNDLAKMVYFHVSNGSTSNRLGFGFYNNDALFNILASGNVGIGTTTPVEKLDVTKNGNQADVNWGAIMIRNTANYSVGNDASIGFALNNAANTNCDPRASIGCKTESDYGGALVFNTRVSAGSYAERVRIHAAGALSVKSGTQPTGNGLHSYFTSDVGYIDSLEANIAWRNLRLAGNDVIISGGGVQRMRIYSTGNIQIDSGELNAPKALYFNANSSAGGNLGSIDWYNVQWDGFIRAQIKAETDTGLSNGRLVFSTGAGGVTERMRITSGGVIYINSTGNQLANATPQLGILAGTGTDAINIKHTQDGNNTLNIWQTGTSTHSALAFYKGNAQSIQGTISVTTSAVTYNSTSDYRLKENIVPLENGLDRLLQLKPSKFNWITTGEETEGFIAHEVQEIFPYAVTGEKDAVYSSTGNIKPQSVDYGRITPLLVKAIQEQQSQIQSLQAEINELKNK